MRREKAPPRSPFARLPFLARTNPLLWKRKGEEREGREERTDSLLGHLRTGSDLEKDSCSAPESDAVFLNAWPFPV